MNKTLSSLLAVSPFIKSINAARSRGNSIPYSNSEDSFPFTTGKLHSQINTTALSSHVCLKKAPSSGGNLKAGFRDLLTSISGRSCLIFPDCSIVFVFGIVFNATFCLI